MWRKLAAIATGATLFAGGMITGAVASSGHAPHGVQVCADDDDGSIVLHAC
jgi:hypothetical protein